jgi:glycerophosphoryl diester phosphodiesterase
LPSAANAQATLRGNKTQVVAHRGGAKESTENTIAAFTRAIKIGADGIETDLRLTRDGVIVIYHDDRFGRVEGLAPAQRTRSVAEMTYAELSAQALLPVGEDTGGRRVPTLQDVLATIKTGWLNLELKRGLRFDELVDKTISALRAFPDLDRVVLETPDLKTAEKMRKAFGPRLKLHINPAFDGTPLFDKTLKRVLKFKPHSISVAYERLSRQIVEAAHRAGVEVWVYTVNAPDIAQTMRLMGADAVKTDSPLMLIELFKRPASY